MTKNNNKFTHLEQQEEEPIQQQKEELPPVIIPYRKFAGLVLLLLSEAITASMLFPYVGFLVARVANVNVEESGYLAGALVASFMLAQTCSTKIWGQISDVVGRLPVMRVGLLLSAVGMIFFGCSESMTLLILSRFFCGLVNGNITVAKVVIAEITDDHSQSIGFACIPFSWSLGFTIAPYLGGILWDPVQNPSFDFLTGGINHNCSNTNISNSNISSNISSSSLLENVTFNNPNNLFVKFPQLLPCIVSSAYSVFAFIVSFFALEESNPNTQPFELKVIKEIVLEYCDFFSSCNKHHRDSNNNDCDQLPTTDEITAESSTSAVESPINTTTTNNIAPAGTATPTNNNSKKKNTFTISDLFKHRNLRIATLLYLVLGSMPDIGFNETLPLVLLVPQKEHGFGMTASEIGNLMLYGGLAVIAGTLSYPFLVSFFPGKRRRAFWRIILAIQVVATVAIPFVPNFVSLYYNEESTSSSESRSRLMYLATLVPYLIRNFFICMSFALIFYYFNGSVPSRDVLGSANGAAQSLCSLVRCITPLIAAPLLALSVNHPLRFIPFVFDIHFVFYICGFCLIICIFLTYSLREPSSAAALAVESHDDIRVIHEEEQIFDVGVILDSHHHHNFDELDNDDVDSVDEFGNEICREMTVDDHSDDDDDSDVCASSSATSGNKKVDLRMIQNNLCCE